MHPNCTLLKRRDRLLNTASWCFHLNSIKASKKTTRGVLPKKKNFLNHKLSTIQARINSFWIHSIDLQEKLNPDPSQKILIPFHSVNKVTASCFINQLLMTEWAAILLSRFRWPTWTTWMKLRAKNWKISSKTIFLKATSTRNSCWICTITWLSLMLWIKLDCCRQIRIEVRYKYTLYLSLNNKNERKWST